MAEKLTLEPYQANAVKFVTSRPHSLLASSVGLGKTAVALEAFSRLYLDGEIKGMLVIAPLRVAKYSWPDEIKKWSEFNWIKIAQLREERGQIACRYGKAHIYVINLEMLPKICEQVFKRIGRAKLPFDMVVIDEIHNIKDPQAKRIKEFYHYYNGMMKVRVGLTGTPASNSLLDLFAPARFLDGGERFGLYPGKFKAQYFKQADYMGYKFELREGAEDAIYEKLADLMLVQSSEEFSDQPDTQVTDIDVTLPPEAREIYKRIKKEFLAELKNGGTITAANAAVLVMKLLQITGGYCYNIESQSEYIHGAKIVALKKLCASLKEPVLIVAKFKHETQAILDAIPGCERWDDGSMIHRWNRGDVKALVVHPKCLHPKTEVLTQFRGWVRIVDVRQDEKVFDGQEFVSHRGCSFSGRHTVIDRFGITMTPDHMLLINNQWVKVKDVRDTEDTRREACYAFTGDGARVGTVLKLRGRKSDCRAECLEVYKRGPKMSQVLRAQLDRHTHLANLAWDEDADGEPKRTRLSPLRWVWDDHVRKMEKVRELLSRYVRRICRSFDARPERQRQRIFQSELSMGNHGAAGGQPKYQQKPNLQRAWNDPLAVLQGSGGITLCAHSAAEQRHVPGRSRRGLPEINVPKEPQISEVYDLVDCGPRNRFLIRNDRGEMFISHNSVGTGINLQKGGSVLIWYGLTYSLTLYTQMCGRLFRKGQTKKPRMYRLLATDTVDEIVAESLRMKGDTESSLLLAVKLLQQNS